jgi:hypothetical protein
MLHRAAQHSGQRNMDKGHSAHTSNLRRGLGQATLGTERGIGTPLANLRPPIINRMPFAFVFVSV